jgi:hypothetical protein
MTLYAYFDASARPNGMFCVAGYAFTRPQIRRFDRDWKALFGVYGGCHMRELATRNGRFKGISDDDLERLMRGAVGIIKRHASFGVVISCVLDEIHPLLPKWIRGFEHAYPVCCHLAMSRLAMLLIDSDRSESIAYFFESGDDYTGSARGFMRRTEDTPQLKESYRHTSHAFVDKSEALALQAADFLAWDWAKYMDETITHKKRPMRLSLMHLMSANGDFDPRYAGIHATGHERFCREVTELGLMQRREEQRGRPN